MDNRSDVVLHERQGRVAVLTINRQNVRNAIDAAVCQALCDHAAALSRDDGIGAVVIRGAGDRAFSAGADLATIAQLDGAAKRRFIEGAWHALDTIARLPIPSIAAIHGYALGGGLELALACDLRVADADAVMGLPEMTLGGVPSFGAVQRLPAIIGRGRAIDMILSGRRVTASEAERIGLVTRLTPQGAAFDTALDMAQELATRPREVVRYFKLALNAAYPGQDAAGLHGMISDLCHSDPTYQSQIARFASAEREP